MEGKSAYAKHANIYGAALNTESRVWNLECENGITEMETEMEYGIRNL